MKCLIHCSESDVGWVEEYFPGQAPYLLPLANKPYLEYLVDYCALQGVDDLVISTDMPNQNFAENIGGGERWNNLRIHYVLVPPGIDGLEVAKRNITLLGDDDLLILRGMIYLDYDQRNFKKLEILPDECSCMEERFRIIGRNRNDGRWDRASFQHDSSGRLSVQPLDSIKRYYDLSMALTHGLAAQYAMPNYNNSPNVYIGQDVSIARSCDIREPIHLGNVLLLAEHTKIGPAAIIGDNCFIDEYTLVSDSIIMHNSYVGCYLEIIHKIVYRNIIIDPETGLKLDIIDNLVLTPISNRSGGPKCSLLQQFSALFMWLIMVLPFLILRPLLTVRHKEYDCFLSADRRKRVRLRLYLSPSESWTARWFRKLSLDRFHLLGMVLRGELKLVGNHLLVVNEANARLLQQFPNYGPGLFSYSEMLGHEKDQFQLEMDELFYVYHACVSLNWKILRKTLLHNLFKVG